MQKSKGSWNIVFFLFGPKSSSSIKEICSKSPWYSSMVFPAHPQEQVIVCTPDVRYFPRQAIRWGQNWWNFLAFSDGKQLRREAAKLNSPGTVKRVERFGIYQLQWQKNTCWSHKRNCSNTDKVSSYCFQDHCCWNTTDILLQKVGYFNSTGGINH